MLTVIIIQSPGHSTSVRRAERLQRLCELGVSNLSVICLCRQRGMYRSAVATALAANPRGNQFWWIWKLIWLPNRSEVVSDLRCGKLQSLYSQIYNWNQSKQDIMSHDGNGILSLEKRGTQCGQTLSILNVWVFPVWRVSIHDYEWVNEWIDKGILGGQAMHEWWRIILES